MDPVDGKLTTLREQQASSLWKFDVEGDGAWSEIPIVGGSPPGIYITELLLDRAGRRLLGVGERSVQDSTGWRADTVQVWQLSLDVEPRWSRILSSTSSAPRSTDFQVALDEEGRRLFLVGGRVTLVLELDRSGLPMHSEATHGPPGPVEPQAGAAPVYVGDVWSFDLASRIWQEVIPSGPALPGAVGGWATFEPSEGRLVLIASRDTLENGDDYRRVLALAVDGDRRWTELSGFGGIPSDLDVRGISVDPVDHRLLSIVPSYYSEPESTRLYRIDLRGPGSMIVESLHGGSVPILRSFELYCVDPETHRLLVVGTEGRRDDSLPYSGFSSVDVWSLPLDGSPIWREDFSSLSPEAVGSTVPVTFDPGRRRIVCLDWRGHVAPNPVWDCFDADPGVAWRARTASGPGPSLDRTGAVAVFDSGRDRVLLFGGGRNGVEFGDLWELSFAFSPPRWRRILDGRDVPRPRQGAAAIFDPVRRRMVLFGGYAGEATNDTWALDLREADPRWIRLPVRGIAPPARWDHSAIYDFRRDAMVVFAGATGSAVNPTPLRDTWMLSFVDGDAWIPLPIGGSLPVSRYGHAAVYDPVGDRMIVLGGRDRSGTRFDSQSLEFGAPSRWVAFLPQGTSPLGTSGGQALYDPVGDRLLTLGPNVLGRVTALEWDRDRTPRPDSTTASAGFRLLRVGPNPTRNEVGIAFEVPKRTLVRARLFDVRGRVVRDLGATTYPPGPHLLWWDGRGDAGDRLRVGVYFARIEVEGRAVTGKIVLID